jgi:AraC-like DNA-binding protein
MRGAQAVLASSRRALLRHSHEQFGVGVIERGGQLSHSGRGQVEAGPGDVITVNPGEVHDGLPLGDSGRAWRILYLDPAIVSLASWDGQEAKDGQVELSHPVLRDKRAADLARRLFLALTGQTCALRQEELLLATLAAIGGVPKAGKLPAMVAEVAKARSLIDEDPVASITLADLAATSGIGRFQLLRSFARATGLTPHAYILQRRLELARRLIAEGAALADCAAASGFADQSHMTRAFASRYGLTPGAFAAASR